MEAKDIISKAGMRLREFASHQPEALENLNEEEKLPGECPKVLGIPWSLKTDQILITVPSVPSPCTRRNILSFIASIFDPLGLSCPINLN